MHPTNPIMSMHLRSRYPYSLIYAPLSSDETNVLGLIFSPFDFLPVPEEPSPSTPTSSWEIQQPLDHNNLDDSTNIPTCMILEPRGGPALSLDAIVELIWTTEVPSANESQRAPKLKSHDEKFTEPSPLSLGNVGDVLPSWKPTP